MKRFIFTVGLVGISWLSSLACTKVMYKGNDNLIMTARSMDWKEEMKSDMWIFPRGMVRDGAVGPHSLKWTSKYGSVITAAYNFSTTDGMNEKGLVANLLWLVESEYPVWDQKKPGLSVSAWVQYVLDSFATVNEAVEALKEEPLVVISDKMPNSDRLATLHLTISDATGDNAILEYIKGRLVIHHNASYQVMTNSPIYEKQLAIYDYWKNIGGTVMLPGTNRAEDRFARASFYIHAIPKTADTTLAVGSVFSVIRNCSVPLGISTPNQPNISSTRWRTVADQKNKVYYFESTLTPNIIRVDFARVDFSEKAPVKVLKLANNESYVGEVSKNFVPSAPFKFLGLD